MIVRLSKIFVRGRDLHRGSLFFCFFSFFLHFILQTKSPTELESKTMGYLNIVKVDCCFFVQQKNAQIPDADPF